MRALGTILACSLAASLLLAADDKERTLTFAKADLGKVPKGWKVEKTGKGEGSVWKVVADETAPSKTGYALAQTAESAKAVFNLCVAEDTSYKDLEVTIAFKPIKGEVDRGGGIVWRYQDADNYYVARANPLERNFRVYKVVAGKRTQLGAKEDLKIAVNEWHGMKIKQAGDQIECWLDDKKHLEAKDDTFAKAGKIGLWSKADAQTYFDDVRVTGK
jgi:hypothetical protein